LIILKQLHKKRASKNSDEFVEIIKNLIKEIIEMKAYEV
jgi:hypothetical protein